MFAKADDVFDRAAEPPGGSSDFEIWPARFARLRRLWSLMIKLLFFIILFMASGFWEHACAAGEVLKVKAASNTDIPHATFAPAEIPLADPGHEPDGAHPELLNPRINQTPEKTVNSLAARANDWREPSYRSEERYVMAIRQWLDSLAPFQRERASKILREAHPGMRALRVAIRDKKTQLATLNFDRDTRPDTLPRLGQELQELRAELRARLKKVGDRLKFEAGVPMGPLGGDGFWLAPPANNAYPDLHAPRIAPDKPHSNNSRPLAFARGATCPLARAY